MAKYKIAKAQEEQCKTFNKSRKESELYCIGDLVAIRRTQFLMSKLAILQRNIWDPTVLSVKGARFEVWKIGDGEGPSKTSTGTDFMKQWCPTINNDEVDVGEDVELNCLPESESVPDTTKVVSGS